MFESQFVVYVHGLMMLQLCRHLLHDGAGVCMHSFVLDDRWGLKLGNTPKSSSSPTLFPLLPNKDTLFVIWVFLEGGVIPRKLNNIFCLGINRMEFPLNFNLFRKATWPIFKTTFCIPQIQFERIVYWECFQNWNFMNRSHQRNKLLNFWH